MMDPMVTDSRPLQNDSNTKSAIPLVSSMHDVELRMPVGENRDISTSIRENSIKNQ